jgi:glutaredoxin
LQIKKNQEEIVQLLAANEVKYELIDVASSEKALQHMKRQNNNGNSDGRAKEVPQVFVGGEYRGVRFTRMLFLLLPAL